MTDSLFKPPRNFAGLQPPYSDLAPARVVIIPVPYDATTEWRSGTRHGPRAIIDASEYLEFYDIESGREIHKVGIHTFSEVQPVTDGPEAMAGAVRRVVADVLSMGKLPVMLGGEHSLTFGAVQAARDRYPDLTVLQLDAHTDLRDEYIRSRFSDACVMRRVSELCPVVPVGIRSSSLEEQVFLRQKGLKPVYMEETRDPRYVDRVLDMLGKHVYVSIDLDVLDPSIMSAVGTPEPGGMGWDQALSLVREVASRRRIIGLDIMELCPDDGPPACAFLAAKLAYKVIGYSLPEREGNDG